MKRRIMLLIGMSILTAACTKVTNVKLVDGPNTGTLSYRLDDDAGNGLQGVKVSIYDPEFNLNIGSPNPIALVGTKLTDEKGIAYFSDLLPRNYLLVADSPMVNNNKYRTDEFVQIVEGIEKKKTIRVSDFSGTFNIRLLSHLDYLTPLKNLGVAAHPVNGVKLTAFNVAEVVKASNLKGITDEHGYVSIRVPSNIAFDLIIFHLVHGNLSWGHGHYRVEKNEKSIITLFTQPL